MRDRTLIIADLRRVAGLNGRPPEVAPSYTEYRSDEHRSFDPGTIQARVQGSWERPLIGWPDAMRRLGLIPAAEHPRANPRLRAAKRAARGRVQRVPVMYDPSGTYLRMEREAAKARRAARVTEGVT